MNPYEEYRPEWENLVENIGSSKLTVPQCYGIKFAVEEIKRLKEIEFRMKGLEK